MQEFGIRETAATTGVTESTLRMWEHRHGFPAPERLAGGHRRYSERDVEAIKRVAELRDGGLSLAAAIALAKQPLDLPKSLHMDLRREHPGLIPQLLSRKTLLALTHAIEDETCARAENAVIFGSFQREEFYRLEESRWREFSITAALVCVFANFKDPEFPAGRPVEVPFDEETLLMREWTIVCDAPGLGVCLSGWEPPHSSHTPAIGRTFETVWSVEPRIVRSAARTCAALARPSIPKLVDRLAERLVSPPTPATDEQLRLATSITSRTLTYLS